MSNSIRAFLPAAFSAIALALGSSALAAPSLSNDEGRSIYPGDSLIPHYEYEEELQRNKIERSLELEITEVKHSIEYDLIEQDIPGRGPRNSFMDSDRTNALSFSSGVFSYSHQLPPAVNPDVMNPPLFNDYDFRTKLIEFEIEMKGIRTGTGAYEVRLGQGGADVAVLGALTYYDHHDSYDKFKFSFEQIVNTLGGSGIAPEIYTALADGILDVRIVQMSSGSGNLFLQESELELEQAVPSAVPEPETYAMLLAGLGLMGFIARRRKQGKFAA